MKEGDVFITTDSNVQVAQGDRVVTLPISKVFTYVKEDERHNVWLNVDGMDCMYIPNTSRNGTFRRLPYPIEKPQKIEEYRELISKIVKDMVAVFGVGVEIEANPFRTKFHLG